jgi:hypothetical protein
VGGDEPLLNMPPPPPIARPPVPSTGKSGGSYL